MFKKTFIDLCNKANQSPTYVCQQLGLSNAAFSQWSDTTVPRQTTLKKIADYFGVSVDYLLGNESNTADLPEQDKKVLQMLHSLDDEGKEKAEQYLELLSLQYKKSDKDKVKEIIKALPDKDDSTVTARIAAFGGGVREVKLSKDDLREIVNMLEKKEKE